MENQRTLNKDIINMATPVFIELFLGSLFGMVDMMMLGQYGSDHISTASIAAVSFTNQIMFIGLSLVASLCTGATAIIARYMGARRQDRIQDVLKHIIIINQVLLAIPFVILSIAFGDQIMTFLGAEPFILEIGRNYYRIILIGFLFQAFNNSVFSALRGTGNTKTPMKINMIVNFTNVIGNAVLIYGIGPFPELGILGAGISTASAQVLAAIVLVVYLLNPKHLIHLNLKKKFKFNKVIIENLLKIGAPAAGEQIVFRIGILRFVKIVAGLGTTVYATHNICLNILSLSFATGQAFSTATSTLVGRSLGEQKLKTAEEYIKRSRRIGIGLGFMLGFLMFFFGETIVSLYNSNPEVIKAGGEVLTVVAIIQPFQNAQFIVAGGLRGAGDTVWTLISTFFSVFIIRIVMAKLFILRMDLGLMGAWYAMLVDQLARFVLINARYYTGKWKYVSIK